MAAAPLEQSFFSYNSKGIGAVTKYVYAGGNKSWE